MSQSPLFGRRIHITGSVNKDSNIATSAEVQRARSIVELLVKTLMVVLLKMLFKIEYY